ncbi:RNA polymerase sigma factor [Methylomonas sp. EFPC1]|nr:RNA polymerase sigma factor [Methylomonas sp. EFPC1]
MPNRHIHLLDFLFQRHNKELLVFAEQRAGRQHAEDLVQDAYLRLLQHGNTDAIDNHRAYLYRITANLSGDLHRREQIVPFVNDEESETDAVACPMPQPDAVAESRERLRICLQALDSLPEIVRTVFLLHRFDGLTYPEIARAFAIPPRTVERYCIKALAHCSKSVSQDID